jgi:hypothetical protein
MASTAKKALDSYANVAALLVEEATANTGKWEKFAFPFSIMDKMALLLSRVEYICNIPGAIAAGGDAIFMGLSVSANLADVSAQNDPLIIDDIELSRLDTGVAASATILAMPYYKDFSTLPGGGILVAPAPLYGYIKGASCGAASSAWIKLYYTYLELAADEYWQLVESRRIISS